MVLGNWYASGEALAISRIAALDAGLGTGVPGAAGVIVAGGAESTSNVEHYALGLRTGVRRGGIALMDRLDRTRVTAGGRSHPAQGSMIETADNLRREYGTSREAQDELSVRPHHRAVAAHDSGCFAEELVAVTVQGKHRNPDIVVEREQSGVITPSLVERQEQQ